MAGRFAPQQARAQRVKRRDPHAAAIGAEQRLDARPHLFGGLVREGDGEHLVRLGMAVADEVGDAARDDARLARACSREDQQRPADVQDRFALLGIEGFQELHVGQRQDRNCNRSQGSSLDVSTSRQSASQARPSALVPAEPPRVARLYSTVTLLARFLRLIDVAAAPDGDVVRKQLQAERP